MANRESLCLILDNGHGDPPLTGGKCSPDGRLKEYYWARDMVQRIAAKARAAGIRTEILVPEKTDVPLKERVRRVNALCAKYGKANCIVISVHINAAPGSGWHTASGFSGWVAPNASAKSKELAKILWECADAVGLRGNRSVPACRYWVGNFAIVRDTYCPAVLTENLFMDNRDEVDFLMSEAGKETIAKFHIDAIKKFIK